MPFAGVPLAPVPAFVASYQSALAINDLITAVLLFSQFGMLRSWALLLLASGYLFTAAAAIVHALTFPGLFAPTGLLNAGPQTTVWLYMIWHGGFPLLVLGYALAEGQRWRRHGSRGSVGAAILTSVDRGRRRDDRRSTWLVTARHDILPTLLSGGHYTATMIGVVSTVWSLSLAALLVLWLRRPHSVLDVWLMVVMCAWLFDIALSAIVNVARFDLGFYVGRIYGLCAASFVLAVLLVDNVALQAQLSRLLAALRRQAATERDRHTERERLFSAVVESSNDAIITKALDGTITAWNRGRRAAVRIYRCGSGRPAHRHHRSARPARRGARYPRPRRPAVKRSSNTRPCARAQGRQTRSHVSLGVSPIRSATGEIIGASKIARDISESKRTQQALSQEIEERQRIFETSQDLILVTDTKGNVRSGQPEFDDHPGIRARGNDRAQRGRIHPSRRSREHARRKCARRGADSICATSRRATSTGTARP